MPYFSIMQSGAPMACAGAPQIDLLIASVIVRPLGLAHFSVHGLSDSGKDKTEHAEWLHSELHPGDWLEITYLQDGSGSCPIPKVSKPVLDASAEIEGSTVDPGNAEQRATFRSLTKAPRPRLLRVSTPSGASVRADLGDEEQLQAVLMLTASKCILEVDAVTVLDGGKTKGKRWLREELSPGQRVKITYAT